MLRGINDIVAKKSDADQEWNSRKGPLPGMKYRGGAPPQPPAWSYNREDLRVSDKWEKKVKVWQLQVASYLPRSDAPMAPYVSLKGEAEEEMEHADFSRINHQDGIEHILNTLRSPLQDQGHLPQAQASG